MCAKEKETTSKIVSIINKATKSDMLILDRISNIYKLFFPHSF